MATSIFAGAGFLCTEPRDNNGKYVSFLLAQPQGEGEPRQQFEVRCDGYLADNVYNSMRRGDSVIVIGHWETVERRAGMNVQLCSFVKASNIGPDARFGVTTFRKITADMIANDKKEEL